MKHFPAFIQEHVLSPAVFQRPQFIAQPLAWVPHIPFAFWLVEAIKPKVLVELGTHSGNSFFAFCQAISFLELSCDAYAVDTWRGDEHAGIYEESVFTRVQSITSQHFAAFARLVRSTFDEALSYFPDGSVDLLHIDGFHTYDAVRHDFETWRPKLSARAVVIFHDTNVRENDFGVWRFWDEVRKDYPSFHFVHGHGMGLLAVGQEIPTDVARLCGYDSDSAPEVAAVREFFGNLGSLLSDARERGFLLESPAAQATPSAFDKVDLSSPLLISQQIAELKSSVRIKSFFNSMLSARLSSQISSNKTLLEEFALLKQAVDGQNARLLVTSELASRTHAGLEEWRQRWDQQTSVIQGTIAWRLMRFFRRMGALLVRGESEGRLGFIRWFIGKLLGGAPTLTRSFDVFQELPLPPGFLLDELATASTQAHVSPSVVESVIALAAEASAVEPPIIHRHGTLNPDGIVDIVIPVKGSVNWLGICLRYLFSYTPSHLIRNVILIDDGSSSSEKIVISALAEQFPLVTIAENIAPHGFGAACNAGAAVGDAPYILLLNSDCLVMRNTLNKMLAACNEDSSVGLVSVLSNNAATLSVEIPEGLSFQEVDAILANYFDEEEESESKKETFTEACTVVGHCLLVTRSCFAATGGFDLSWGLGYGEESDLQMRAGELGYRGVVLLDTFVYHFGGGTFRYQKGREQLQQVNHARFMQLWGEKYQELHHKANPSHTVEQVRAIIERNNRSHAPDVLFILPGFTHSVGGIMVAVDICNDLLSHDIDAKILILGQVAPDAIGLYPEALFFAPLYARDQEELIAMGPSLRPKVVVSTLFTTCFPAARFAAATNAKFVNFVQGYEFYFDNGIHYADVVETYRLSEVCLTTSKWLADGINRHSASSKVYQLPLGIDPYTFFPAGPTPRRNDMRVASKRRKLLRVAIVLRSQADKGQWILREILEQLIPFRDRISISVVGSAHSLETLSEAWQASPETRRFTAPIDRYTMGSILRECEVFVDSSLHEGFGLLPLEAMASGCAVIASNSGGITEYLRHEENGIVIEESLQPTRYVEAISRLLDDVVLLERLKNQARLTGIHYSRHVCFERYRRFFGAYIAGDEAALLQLQYHGDQEEEASVQDIAV